MLANDITLDNKDGTDVVFRLVSQDKDGTRRIDVASTLALPAVLTIKHTQSGKAPNVIDRHLVQLNKVVPSTLGTVSVNVNFTITVPRDVSVTPVMIHNAVSNVLDFLSDGVTTGMATTANVDAILRGES